MNENDIVELLNRMVHRDVQTSYKPYLLRAILELSKDNSRASFDELATYMFAFAWNDTINPEYHFRKTDAILWAKADLMEEAKLSEYATFDESLSALQKISSEKIKHKMGTVVLYSPWSMLNVGQWTNELSLLPTYWKKMEFIAEKSTEDNCLYVIEKDGLLFNSEYFDIIRANLGKFVALSEKGISDYLKRPKK